MKCRLFITFFSLIFLNMALAADESENRHAKLISEYIGDNSKFQEIMATVKKGIASSKETPAEKAKLIYEEATKETTMSCSHCPTHIKLTGSINKILEKMRKDPKVNANDEVPISINRLRYLYYVVKTREEDGSIRCSRYGDITPDLKPTRFDGQMDLMAQDVFKFEAVSSAQLLDPKSEEVTYYYRGEGDQKNIIVQAVLGKDGGKFRYFYYRPTEKEKNPYGLPSMGEPEPKDATVRVKKKKFPEMKPTAEDIRDAKNKFKLKVSPTIETEEEVIPTGLSIANTEVSQNIAGNVRVNANSKLSLKGNETQMSLQNEKGFDYVQLEVQTSLTGDVSRKVVIPYEVTLGPETNEDSLKVKGSLEDSINNQTLSLALTDKVTQHFRTEIKRDKTTNINAYSVARDFEVDKEQKVSVAVGKNEERKDYVSFQHKKTIKDNLTMVLDVRIDQNKKASFTYQLTAKF